MLSTARVRYAAPLYTGRMTLITGTMPIRSSALTAPSSHENPLRRVQVAGVVLAQPLRCEPLARRDHRLVRPRVEPGSPPTERAVGNHMMAALRHQRHVLPWAFRVAAHDRDPRAH